MCTLTYLPLPDNNFLLTSNRDESPKRPKSIPPAVHLRNQRKIIYPEDGLAGGTWIAASENGRCASLMNGAFKPHFPQPPYRKSRGLMVLESFDFADAAAFFSEYNFNKIEPFTYVAVERFPDGVKITEARWDSQQLHLKDFDASVPHIWSSASLYDTGAQELREQWFREWLLKNPGFSRESIVKFHLSEYTDHPADSIRMNRILVKTLSLTSISILDLKINMLYIDLDENQELEVSLHT